MKTNDIYSKDGNELIRGNVRVEWVNLGEGLSEDYNPNDPTDVNILRFDVSVKKFNDRLGNPTGDVYEWQDPGNASYATRFPASADINLRKKGLKVIMDRVYDYASEGLSIKKIGEEMSWLTVRDVSKTRDFWVQGLTYLTITILTAFMAVIAFMVTLGEKDIFALFLCVTFSLIACFYVLLSQRSWRLDSDIRKIREAYPQP